MSSLFKRVRPEARDDGQRPAVAEEPSLTPTSSTSSLPTEDTTSAPGRTRSVASAGSGQRPLARLMTGRARSRAKSSPGPSSPVTTEHPPPMPRYSERHIVVPSSSSDEEGVIGIAPFLPEKVKQALRTGPTLPILPDELLAALDRAPEERKQARVQDTTPRHSPQQLLGSSSKSLPLSSLPAIPAYSPLQLPSPTLGEKLKSKASKGSLTSHFTSSSSPTTRSSPMPSQPTLDSARAGGLGISAVDLPPHDPSALVDEGRRYSMAIDRSPRQSTKRRASTSMTATPASLGIEDELDVANQGLAPPVELYKPRSNTSIYYDAHNNDDDDVTAVWQAPESFAHDLVQRRRYLRQTRREGKAPAAVPLEDEIEAATDSDDTDADVSEDDGEDTLLHTHLIAAAQPPPRHRTQPGVVSTSNGRAPIHAENGMRARLQTRRDRSFGPTPEDPSATATAQRIHIPANLVPTRTPSAEDAAPRTAPLVPSDRFRSSPSRPSPLSTPSKEADDPLALRGRSMSDGVLATAGHPSAATASSVRARPGVMTDETELSNVVGLQQKRPSLPAGGPSKLTQQRSRSGSLLKEVSMLCLYKLDAAFERRRQALVGNVKAKADLVIAVVGPRGVGKSTIIAKGLRKPSTPTVLMADDAQNKVISYVSTFTIAGLPRAVEILEVDAAILRYTPEGLTWPASLPALDGAMLCYDATDADALTGLKRMLNGFWTRGGMTLIVLACKSRSEEALNRVNPNKAASAANVYGAGTVQLDGGIDDEGRKMRNSFQWVVRTVLIARGDISSSERGSRPGTSLSMASSSFEPTSPSRRPRAAIEAVSPKRHTIQSPARAPLVSPTKGVYDTAIDESQASYRFPAPSPADGVKPYEGNSAVSAVKSRPKTPPSKTVQLPPSTRQASNATAASDLPTAIRAHLQKQPELDLLMPKDEVIDKFLFAAVTSNDEEFVDHFVIVFRRFARPHEVLVKLFERYDFISTRLKTDPILSRYAHMQLCGALSRWLTLYPGDFVAPATYALLKPFLENLILSDWVAHYAVELLPQLRVVSEQSRPEGPWCLPDTDDPTAGLMSRKQSLAPSVVSNPATSHKRLSAVIDETDTTSSTGLSLRGRSVSDTLSTGTADSSERTSATGGSVTTASRKLAKERPRAGWSLLDYSNALMGASHHDVAREITRMSWDIFVEMKPRDLLRYVMTPRDAKNPGQAPQRDESNPVSRSIRFVNFLADWTATLILVQNKHKHRVRIIEKFIEIALALRADENYDGLMGILAGLNSQPVFRLRATFDLLKERNAEVEKRFRSLNRLMATAKGFAAYRLALSTSSPAFIPYLGFHLQDITRVCEGKSDMRDGLVNWSKFQQLAKCAAVVLDCHRLAPRQSVDPNLERLVMSVPVLSVDDEALYSLSYSIQPRGHRSKLRKLLDAVNNSVTPVTEPLKSA